MSKVEIIRMIAEQEYNVPDVILQACKNELKKEVDLKAVAEMYEVLGYNLSQIKMALDLIMRYDRNIQRLSKEPIDQNTYKQIDKQKDHIEDMRSQIESYKLNIKNAIEKI